MGDKNKKDQGFVLEFYSFGLELSLIKIQDSGGWNYFFIYTGLFQILSLIFVNELDFDFGNISM